MKRTLILLGVGALAGAGVCIVPTNRQCTDRELQVWKSSLVSGITSLEQFRGGDTNRAFHVLESHTFAAAVVLLERRPDDPTVRAMVRDLVDYRRSHNTNSAQWTSTEMVLEALIQKETKRMGAGP